MVKELNGAVRSDTRRLLEKWNDPIILLGKVKEISKETVLIEQILDNEMYKLPLSPDSELAERDIVFGIALYDDRNPSTTFYLINGLYVLLIWRVSATANRGIGGIERPHE